MNNNIIFKKIDNNFNDYELLYKWCQKEYIYEWFEQRKLSMDEVKFKYSKKINDNIQTLFIFYINNIPIGYIQYYKSDYIDDAYEYDLFIGEEDYLSKGYGTKIINKLNNYIFDEEKCNSLILRPFKRNVRAIKAYIKCGFRIIDNYLDKDTIGNKEEIVVMRLDRIDKYLNQDINKPKYLFHGSTSKLEYLEPKQSHDSNNNIDNIANAIFLFPSFLKATPYAFKDTIKKLSKNLDWNFEISNYDTYPLMRMKNVIVNDDIIGYIYVFLNNDRFIKDIDTYQYKCYSKIKPIDIIEVKYKDYKKYYETK